MPRPSQLAEQRKSLLPVVARAFVELGYRRATTAELAKRCGVRQNILYRLWPDKKGMFVAAIDYVYEFSLEAWKGLLSGNGAQTTPAERLLAYESGHHGEFGHYRIVFAGLNETDDPDIRAALRRMYGRFQRLFSQQIAAHRGPKSGRAPDAELAAWAVIGLGTVANIGRELGLLSDRRRARLIDEVGRLLLGGSAS